MAWVTKEYVLDQDEGDSFEGASPVWDLHLGNFSFKSTFQAKIGREGIYIKRLIPGLFTFIKPIRIPWHAISVNGEGTFIKTKIKDVRIEFFRPGEFQGMVRQRAGATDRIADDS